MILCNHLPLLVSPFPLPVRPSSLPPSLHTEKEDGSEVGPQVGIEGLERHDSYRGALQESSRIKVDLKVKDMRERLARMGRREGRKGRSDEIWVVEEGISITVAITGATIPPYERKCTVVDMLHPFVFIRTLCVPSAPTAIVLHCPPAGAGRADVRGL